MIFSNIKILKIIITVFSILSIYFFVQSLSSIKNNIVNSSKIGYNRFRYKIDNLSFINKISCYIYDIENLYSKKNKILTPIKILLISLLILIFTFVITYKYLCILSTSFILSAFSFFIPYILLKEVVKNNKNKILDVFPTYLISLKNYTKTDNDILNAFKRVDINVPLSTYINRFNVSIESGINVFDSFEKLKIDINISKINDFLTASQYCYLNGGKFSKILDKYSNILNKYNLQKEKEKEESLGPKVVLYVLILMNMYILFGFVLKNIEYRNIILGTLFGKIIININLFSYILIFFFTKKMNNLEE